MTFLYSGGKKIADPEFFIPGDPERIGVFESLRTYAGKIFRLDEHTQRFMESARTAGFDSRLSAGTVKLEIERALAAFKKENPAAAKEDLFIRITVWPEKGREVFVLVMIGKRSHPPEIYKSGVVLKTSSVRRSLSHASPPQAKTTDYKNALMATLEPSPGYEWVFLDQQGFVTEVRIGNLFIIKQGGLLTPPLTGILNGVTRRFVIECASLAGLKTKETPLSRHEIYNADEAFLTNTSWEILPVREMDGRRIGGKIPGNMTRKLQKLFKEKASKCP